MKKKPLHHLRSAWKKLLVLAFFSTPFTAFGQASCYAPTITLSNPTSGGYAPISGGTLLGTGRLDDDGFGSVGIGFTFKFNGNNYTQIGISANGYIQFGSAAPGSGNRTFLNSSSVNGVAAFSRDLQGSSTTSTMRVQTLGSAPSRGCVIQWSDWGDFQTTSNDDYNFQIRLYEKDNVIEVMYGTMTGDNSVTGDVGIKDLSSQISAMSITAGSNTWSTATNIVQTQTGGGGPTAAITASFGPPSGLIYTWARLNTLHAGFSAPDTAYAGTIVDFTNHNPIGFNHFWDLNSDYTTEATTSHFRYLFNVPGTYTMRLLSQNCGQSDSMRKIIVIRNPTSRPEADFVASLNLLQIYEQLSLIDMSTNGATSWAWEVFDASDSAATRLTASVLNGSDPYINRMPLISINTAGLYTVCLRSSNMVGSSVRVCKRDYIEVTPQNKISMGAVQESDLRTGTLYDNGGPNGNYADNTVQNVFTIKPCRADTIRLSFQQFKLLSGDFLKVYDGFSAGAKALHSGNGFTQSNPPPAELIAASGGMYLYFSSNNTGNDSGFIANWSTSLLPNVAPAPAFQKPADTIFTHVNYKFINTSGNTKGLIDYNWSVDGTPVSNSVDLQRSFSSTGNYEVNLTVSSCRGDSTFTDSVVVVNPGKAVTVNFYADQLRPALGEQDTFHAVADFATNFEWTFTPNSVEYLDGTNKNSEHPIVRFTQCGPYSVALTAWHQSNKTLTQRSVNKSAYLIAVCYCQPFISVATTSDIGISRVLLEKGTDVLIDNSSDCGVKGYNDYSAIIGAKLTFGVDYAITLQRNTTANPMNRKVWIDYNIDGDFNDPGELVSYEAPSNNQSFTDTFRVPSIDFCFVGKTMMRVGVAYNNMQNTSCGPNSVGEFEDYAIWLLPDEGPKLELLGNDTLYLEVGSVFTDPWAYAYDSSEGDISDRITVISDLDIDNVGYYTVTYVIRDASGNKASVSRVIKVLSDITPPVVTLTGADTIVVHVHSTYAEPGATAYDLKDGNITSSINTTGNVNTNVIGVYYVKYEVGDSKGNMASKTRVVIVNDTVKPLIHAMLSNKIQIGTIFDEDDYIQVSDNYDVNITYKRSGPVVTSNIAGIYEVVYTAMDVSGNIADTVKRSYRVDDFIPPVIYFTFSPSDTIIHDVHTPFKQPEPKVSDNYYDESVITLSKSSNWNSIHTLGWFYFRFIATDPSGNIDTAIVWVHVVDRVKPVIKGDPLYVKTNKNYNPMAGLYLIDNHYDKQTLLPLVQIVFHNVNIYKEGSYFINYQVMDPSGNTSDIFTRLVFVDDDYPATGLELPAALSMSVYPNPANSNLFISYKMLQPENPRLEIYDAVGARVYSAELDVNSDLHKIDLNAFAAGVYFVKLINADAIKTEKIVITR